MDLIREQKEFEKESSNYISKMQLQTQVLIVYVDSEIGTKMIEEASAISLGLNNYPIVFGNQTYYAISNQIIDELVNTGYKIQYTIFTKTNDREFALKNVSNDIGNYPEYQMNNDSTEIKEKVSSMVNRNIGFNAEEFVETNTNRRR